MSEDNFRLPTEIPLEIYPSPEEFVEEAKSIVREAEEKGIVLRVMGGLGIYILIQNTEYEDLWRRMERLGERVFTDIDLAGYGKDRERVLKFLTEERSSCVYQIWRPSLYYYRGSRYIFYGCPEGCEFPKGKGCKIPMVEVFFDRLQMNHTIEFKGRLEHGKYALPLTEILLTKLQIVKINEKDIKDAIVLLSAFEIGSSDKEGINGDYIAGLMSKDWGFYYTFTTNLKKVREYVTNRYRDKLSEDNVKKVSERIDHLLKLIEDKPKSMGWKLRAKVGPKKKWYNEVDDWY
jgi:hypothetical protein